MRPAHLILATLVLVAVPTAAASETWGCHTYETYVGDKETGAGVSHEDGAAAIAAGGFYAISDGTPLVNDFIFSVWVYQESNGQPGLQRGCEDDPHHPGEAETIIL